MHLYVQRSGNLASPEFAWNQLRIAGSCALFPITFQAENSQRLGVLFSTEMCSLAYVFLCDAQRMSLLH